MENGACSPFPCEYPHLSRWFSSRPEDLIACELGLSRDEQFFTWTVNGYVIAVSQCIDFQTLAGTLGERHMVMITQKSRSAIIVILAALLMGSFSSAAWTFQDQKRVPTSEEEKKRALDELAKKLQDNQQAGKPAPAPSAQSPQPKPQSALTPPAPTPPDPTPPAPAPATPAPAVPRRLARRVKVEKLC